MSEENQGKTESLEQVLLKQDSKVELVNVRIWNAFPGCVGHDSLETPNEYISVWPVRAVGETFESEEALFQQSVQEDIDILLRPPDHIVTFVGSKLIVRNKWHAICPVLSSCIF